MFDCIYWVGMSQLGWRGTGDHAQTYAIGKFLKKNYPKLPIIKCDRLQTKQLLKENPIEKNDLILINSAGDFGNWCLDFHNLRRKIVKKYPKNRIVQLPVTIYYTDPNEFEIDKQLFSCHKNFLLMARDLESWNIIKNDFECQTIFYPDLVFSLKPTEPVQQKEGVNIVLRRDMESIFNDRLYKFLRSHRKTSYLGKIYYHSLRKLSLSRGISKAEKLIKNFSLEVSTGDIQTSNIEFTEKNFEKLIFDTINYYQKYKVTVTDRFHSFVFSTIAGTPCIGLTGGIPHKINGYVNLVNTLLTTDFIKDLPSLLPFAYVMDFIKPDFSKYFDYFKEIIEKTFCSIDTIDEPDNPQNNPFLDVIMNRRSVRRWNKKIVSKNNINSLLIAGMYAPSACNIQAVRFFVVTDPYKIKELVKQTSLWFRNNLPSVVIVVMYDFQKANLRGFNFKKNHRWKRFIFQDTSASIQNILIMAKSLGLETCWCSIPPKTILELGKPSKEQQIKNILNLDNRYFVASMVFVGYSDTTGNINGKHQGYSIMRKFNEFVLNPDFKQKGEMVDF